MARSIGIRIGVPYFNMTGMGGGGSISANAVRFDGTNDWLTRAAGPASIADGQVGTFNVRFNRQGNTGQQTILWVGTWAVATHEFADVLIEFDATDHLHFQLKNSSGTNVLEMTSTTTYTDSTEHHALIWFDLGSIGLSRTQYGMRVDDTDETGTPTVGTATDIDFTDKWLIGIADDPANLNKLNGELGEIWFHTARLNGNESHIYSLFDSGGAGVDISTDGSVPLGKAPFVYLHTSADTGFGINSGTGGDFTETGALAASTFAAAVAAPSDPTLFAELDFLQPFGSAITSAVTRGETARISYADDFGSANKEVTDASGNVTAEATDSPVFEHNPITPFVAKGVRINDDYANICLQSETFNNASWTKTNGSVTADDTTAPNNAAEADKIVEASDTGQEHFATQAIAMGDNDKHVFSVWVKASERTIIFLRTVDKGSVVSRTWFNLSTGAIGTQSGNHGARIEEYKNSWYRCAVVFDPLTGIGTPEVGVGLADADNSATYNGDGSSGAHVWGASCVDIPSLVGDRDCPFMPYVPTTTTIQDPGETTLKVDADWYNPEEGTIFIEIEVDSPISGSDRVVFTLADDSADNNGHRVFSDNGLALKLITEIGGAQVVNAGSALAVQNSTIYKIAIGYAADDVVLYVAGVQRASDTNTSGAVAIGANRLTFAASNNSSHMFMWARSFKYYSERKSNAELVTLTT